jgi:molybdate transport system substrate-binding protein
MFTSTVDNSYPFDLKAIFFIARFQGNVHKSGRAQRDIFPYMTLTSRTLLLVCAALLSTASAAADLTVSAASSLSTAFNALGHDYEARHPGTKILFNFGASGALLQQLAKGAPVDVFAAADQETMDAAQQQGLVKAADRRNFAGNALVVITPGPSPTGLASLADLQRDTVIRIAIGNPASVPVGRYTRRALDDARLWVALSPKTVTTQNVRQSLDYVARGEVDAGFVYATDAALMPGKVSVAFQVPLAMPITYPAAPLAASPNGAEARRFAAYLVSAPAQAILARFGFRQP